MILIYSDKKYNRLKYILEVIFGCVLKIPYRLTKNPEKFQNYNGPKINYSQKRFGNIPHIKPAGLLSENGISEQKISFHKYENIPVFFVDRGNGILPFDIFSAAFYLVTRYEEYLDFARDEHGRFSATQSLAFENGFLEIPLVNYWCLKLADNLKQTYGGKFVNVKYRFLATIDVDNAYAYKHKPFLKTAGSLIKSLFTNGIKKFLYQLKVVAGVEPDPYKTYGYIKAMHKKNNADTLFFFLLGNYGKYDRGLNPKGKTLKIIINYVAESFTVGLHPSYASNEDSQKFKSEKDTLAEILSKKVKQSRQHYLMLKFPQTYQKLIEENIKKDYSMGYADRLGFRASIACPYPFYDLKKEETTDLTITPFQAMDVTLKNYMGLNPEEALERTKNLINHTRHVKGMFCSLWHNESLSDVGEWKDWRKTYESMLEYASV